MPIGVICNTLAIVIGGVAGAVLGGRMADSFKEKLTLVFGVCALGIGITSIILLSNLPAVILPQLLQQRNSWLFVTF